MPDVRPDASPPAPDTPAATLPTDQAPPETNEIAEQGIRFGERLRQPRTIISFLISAVIIVLVVTKLNIDPAAVWQDVKTANLWYLLLAFAVYYASFPVRALRWRTILINGGYDEAHGVPLPSTYGLMEIIVLSWFANTLLPAKLGDVYRGYLFKKATGVAFTRSVGTILAERLLDIVGLFCFLVVSGFAAFGRDLPEAGVTLFIFGGVLCVVGIVGLFTLRQVTGLVERLVPAKIAAHYRRLEEGVFGSFGRWPALLGYTTLIWIQEGLRVLFITRAVHLNVGIAVTTFVALAASLLTTVPFTPSGLGAVETGIVGVLQFVGVNRNAAASVAVIDRVIGYWSILLLGGVVYLISRRK